MYNPFSLEGKTILVTGASSGIGRGIAVECSKMGAKVVITGRNETRLLETFNLLSGVQNVMLLSDFNSEEGIKHLVSSLPLLNGIVHCAGITDNSPFLFATRKKFNEVMDVNFYAPAEITRIILKSKIITKNSSIVFISSISGIYTSAIALSVYSASKGALNGFIKSLALELAQKEIRVNSINPGIVETNIFNSEIITSENLEKEKQKYPLKRFGKPSDIAYAAVYLLSDASSWITGTNIVIDGGFTLQ